MHPDFYDEVDTGYVYNSAPSTIPIFILRPFLSSLLSASALKVVQRLQSDGDVSTFWVDTSGWLEGPSKEDISANRGTEDFSPATPADGRPNYELTEAGNRKIATLLHMHLCLYLESDSSECPFLRHEAGYAGQLWKLSEKKLDRVIEDSKLRKLRKMFWDNE